MFEGQAPVCLPPISGTKKEPKPKLFGPDIFGWGGGLPREGVGGRKVRYAPRNQGNQTFLAGYPGILPGYPGGARKVWEEKVYVQFSFPTKGPKTEKFKIFKLSREIENFKRATHYRVRKKGSFGKGVFSEKSIF